MARLCGCCGIIKIDIAVDKELGIERLFFFCASKSKLDFAEITNRHSLAPRVALCRKFGILVQRWRQIPPGAACDHHLHRLRRTPGDLESPKFRDTASDVRTLSDADVAKVGCTTLPF